MDWLPLHAAAYNGDTAAVTQLLSEGHAVDERMRGGFTPLLWACLRAQVCDMIPTIDALIAAGADIEAATSDASCLMLAAQSGSEQTVKALVRYGANVDRAVDGVTPLMVAATGGQFDVVKALIEAGASPHLQINGVSAEEYALYHGHDEIAEFILQIPVSPFPTPKQ